MTTAALLDRRGRCLGLSGDVGGECLGGSGNKTRWQDVVIVGGVGVTGGTAVSLLGWLDEDT